METRKSTGDTAMLKLIQTSSWAVCAQLFMVIATIVIIGVFGPKPETVQEAFAFFNADTLTGMLRADLYNIMMISLYLFTVPGIVYLLLKTEPSLAIISVVVIFAAVILALSSHSGFSLYHLSKEFLATNDPEIRREILAAGRALMANDMWNGSAGYFGGFFLQGGGILLCLAMRKSGIFSLVTIVSGIGANALDLVQHAMHPFVSAVPQFFMFTMGPLYLVWFVSLALDLFRYVRNHRTTDVQSA